VTVTAEATVPLAMMSVAWDGSVGTFSPELLGTSHARFGDFYFGNVLNNSIHEIANESRLVRAAREISIGVDRCRSSCRYFAFCRGGAPSNKLGETGRFDSTTTMFCTLTQKTTVEIILRALEHDLDVVLANRKPRMK
jgi:uncharacterized protein